MNLIRELHIAFSIPLRQIEQGIILRANKIYADTYFIEDWLNEEQLIPDWAKRAAAVWIIEMWMQERDNCGAATLLKIDEKYTRMLKDFSLADILVMRNQIKTAAVY